MKRSRERILIEKMIEGEESGGTKKIAGMGRNIGGGKRVMAMTEETEAERQRQR